MTTANKGGRPTKLTDEIQQAILDALSMGNFVETACAVAGIHKDTFYHWLKLADDAPNGRHAKFRAAVQQAMAQAENDAVSLITAAGTTQWQALAWRLERMYPERWGQRMKVDADVKGKTEHSGPGGGPIPHRHVVELEFVDAHDGQPAAGDSDTGAVPS